LRAKSELSESQRELQKYTEDEEEDYDDMFEQDDKPSAGEWLKAGTFPAYAHFRSE
jgi:hypothetical protein